MSNLISMESINFSMENFSELRGQCVDNHDHATKPAMVSLAGHLATFGGG